MRAVFALFVVGACTPDIVSGSYLCGPNASCPGELACNGPDNKCVLASTVQPFSCTPDLNTEPDDSAATAHMIPFAECFTPAAAMDNCMLQGDAEDWVKLTPPAMCTSVAIKASVSYTLAFEQLSLELWDLETNTQIGSDTECPDTGEDSIEQRCLTQNVTPGKNYGIKVKPSGDGDCNGQCPYNRYTLRVQLTTPG